MNRFLLLRARGRAADVEDEIRHAVVEFPWYPLHRGALACLLAETGRAGEARAVVTDLARDEFHALHRDNEWLLGAALAAEACALVGDAASGAVLYEQLLPYAGRHAIGHAEGSVGALDRYLGLLCGLAGNLDRAVAHLQAAVHHNEQMGARPWTALSQHDLAVALRLRGAGGDAASAGALDAAALATARELGMALADRIAGAVEATDETAADRSAVFAAATFRRNGDIWEIDYGGDRVSLRDARGLHHLARLLAAPGHEIHALDLAMTGDGGAARRDAGFEVLGSDPMAAHGPILDVAARAAYRERIQDLQADIAEAEAWNDPERAARAEAELDALTQQLASAVGLGGRDRPAGSAGERARISVTRAIRSAIARIAIHSPSLAAHLEATIRTGTYCSYTPDPRAPIAWDVG
jgi:hypothetical protein